MGAPILVFGMPRSGTTWVGKLFDSHPDTLYRHEPDSVHKLALPIYPEHADAPAFHAELRQFVAALPRERATKVVGKLPLFGKSYQGAAGRVLYRLGILAGKVVGRGLHTSPCLFRPTGRDQAQVRVVWKSIESSTRLGACLSALPQARAIHLIRHPCGYAASQLRGLAAGKFHGQPATQVETWQLEALLATASGRLRATEVGNPSHLSAAQCLAWRWVLTQEKILADTQANPHLLTVCYEDVCADPLGMTRRMFAFADLPWSAQTEAFVQASTTQAASNGTGDYYSVYRKPQAAAQRWHHELAPEAIEEIMSILHVSPLAARFPATNSTKATP